MTASLACCCRTSIFPVAFPEKEVRLTKPDASHVTPSPVTRWRKRRQRQGFVRVEVQVRKEDANLVREVASALADPARAEGARALLRESFASARKGGLKALLAAAPLEGIELERSRDVGRDVAL